MGKLVWRVKLVAETGGPATEIEVARIEREDWAVPETFGPITARWQIMGAAAMKACPFQPPSSRARSTRSCQSA